MPDETKGIDFELLKRVIEESGLSTNDLLSKILGLGDIGPELGPCDSGCQPSCVTCQGGCSSGPSGSRYLDPHIIYPHEWERLKREIIAELRG